MHRKFLGIKAVGFDLDRTLYEDCPEINDRVTNQVALRILRERPELESINKVRNLYEAEARAVGSWPKVLARLGINTTPRVMHECMEMADILSFINRDDLLASIMELLYNRYYLFLITGSSSGFTLKVLARIGLRPSLFGYLSFGDEKGLITKDDGSVFKKFLEQSSFAVHEHVYIGDNPRTDIIIPRSLGMKTISVGRQVSEADLSISHIHSVAGILL